MTLVERETELSLLRELFTECLAGRGHVAIITGPVASGKTTLLQTFARQAVGAGAVFLDATASSAEQLLPLGVLGQLFRRADLRPEVGERVAGLLEDGAFSAMLTEPQAEAGERVPAHVLHGLCMALLDLSKQTPLVVAIDDVHHADVPSLQCLSYLVRRLRSVRVLLVLSATTRTRPVHPLFHADLVRQPHCRRIQLRLLSPAGVEATLAEHLPAQTAQRLAPDLHAMSGGNPLLVQALLDDYRCSVNPAASFTPGPSFGQYLVSCLYRCEATTLQIARGLAVAGDDTSPELLGRLLDLGAEAAAASMNSLNAAGILNGGRFRHEMAAAAVLDAMAPEGRAQLHARAAHLLQEEGASPAVIARQLLAAETVDADWIVPVLHEAADQALTDGDIDLALSCMRLAHQASTNETQRACSRALLASAEWRVNPSVAARHIPDLLTAVRAGHLTGRHSLRLINWLMWLGRVDEAMEVLELTRRAASQPDSPILDSLCATEMWLASSYPPLRSRLDDLRPTDQQVRPKSVSPHLQAATLLSDVLTHGASDSSVAIAEQVIQGSHLDEETLGSIATALRALIYGDRLDEAALWCQSLAEEAATRRAPTWRAFFSSLRAEIAYRQGDLPDAESHARTALTLISPRSWGVLIGLPLATMLRTSTVMGKYEDALSYLRMPVPDAMFKTPVGLHYLQARGSYHFGTDRFLAALADFQSCGELMARWDLDHPALVPWRSDAAQASLRLGNLRHARELMAGQLARLGPAQSRTRGITLRSLAATSDLEKRPELLRQAVETLQDCGDLLELAHALADLSQAHHALSRFSQARVELRRAQHIAQQCGAAALTRAFQSDSLGGESSDDERALANAGGMDELSDAERRVAALAAQGHTNRQIANRLYVTVSTVEQHLTRVYRKLNVNRRSDLPLGPHPA